MVRVAWNKGIPQNKEDVEKRSDLLRKRYASGELKAHSNGIPFRDKDWRDKIAKSLKGRPNAMKGKHYPKEVRDKMSKAQSGANNPNWKGGITPDWIKDRNSIHAQVWRLEVFERDKFTCQKCRQVGGKLNSHHKNSFSLHKELRFDVNNGITLCEKEHRQFHNIYGKRNNTEKQLIEFLK